MTGFRIEPLRRDHIVDGFTCGHPALDRFLIRHALQAQAANSARTYVALESAEVVGFHTLIAGEVQHANAPDRIVKGMPRHPIPLLILARLAVHTRLQGKGLGASLLRDALDRALQAIDLIGARALAVHAKDEAAASFYRHFGFVPSPTDPRHLFLLVKDIRGARSHR
ncbi:GNAT family N-acetyltransferase [Methylobacterium sp. 17Sr1-1]|nr:GNAT family N-acetyltransferase [Methylobacterium sp. 17Sr1-1]